MMIKIFNLLWIMNIAFCNPVNQKQNSLHIDDTSILDSLQGQWILKQNPNETILIKGDSITYFYKGINPEKFLLEVSKKILYNGKTMVSQPNNYYFFQVIDNNTSELYYLQGVIKNEFSLMSYVNGQTLVYNRKNANLK